MAVVDTVFSIFSFLTFVLVSIPFCWHLEAWNTGTCLYMAWTALANLNFFINSIIWRGNIVNWAPVWCDISTKFMFGVTIALPAASLCINRNLYRIASVRAVFKSKADKRREILIDLLIGIGIPVLFMVLHYIVQGHRFDIYEDYGCFYYTWNTPIAYLIVQAPILLLSSISCVFSVLSIIAFKKRHVEMKILLSSNATVTPNRYVRLICLASLEILFSVPICLSSLIISATRGDVEPWVSWEDTHFNFSRVPQYPAIFWRNNPGSKTFLELTRWNVVVFGLFFFGFFGFAEEARKKYGKIYAYLVKRLGLPGATNKTIVSGSSNQVNYIPDMITKDKIIYIQREFTSKRSSIDTFASGITLKDVDGFLKSEATMNFSLSEKPLPLLPQSSSFEEVNVTVISTVGGLLQPSTAVSSSTTLFSPPQPAQFITDDMPALPPCITNNTPAPQNASGSLESSQTLAPGVSQTILPSLTPIRPVVYQSNTPVYSTNTAPVYSPPPRPGSFHTPLVFRPIYYMGSFLDFDDSSVLSAGSCTSNHVSSGDHV